MAPHAAHAHPAHTTGYQSNHLLIKTKRRFHHTLPALPFPRAAARYRGSIGNQWNFIGRLLSISLPSHCSWRHRLSYRVFGDILMMFVLIFTPRPRARFYTHARLPRAATSTSRIGIIKIGRMANYPLGDCAISLWLSFFSPVALGGSISPLRWRQHIPPWQNAHCTAYCILPDCLQAF